MMKFKVDLKEFAEGLGIVGRAVAVKGVRAILSNVLVLAGENQLQMVGTDQEIMALARVNAQVENHGQCTIPAKLLQEVISNLPVDGAEGPITLEQPADQESMIHVMSRRGKYHLLVQGTEEYPPFPILEREEFPKVNLSGHALAEAMKQVVIAVGAEEANPVQRSMCFLFQNGELRLVATDSKRLAVTVLRGVTVPKELEKTFLVPGRAVSEVLKIAEATPDLAIGLFKEQLVFLSPKHQFLTRLLEGRFPDYQRVIPKECSRKAIFDVKALIQSIKAVLPIARQNSFMMSVDIGPNETRVWSQSKNEGTSEMFISSELNGEPIQIAFNARYLLDFLGVVNTEKVSLEMTTPSYPGLLKPVAEDNPYQYVVMPISML